ncbi:hypothetical protein [Thioalkalivibrio sp.]|uniref:hypothetical protein n=1 Tax=Thioalkalivibrio sp. TaxID=2093813 RepID=UPI0039766E51
MKRSSFPVLKGAAKVMAAVLVAIGVWALMACGGSSSDNGDGDGAEPSAFVFGPDTALEAAYLAADILDVFKGVSTVNEVVLGLVEGGAEDVDLSDDLCTPGGSATLNATQPFGSGTSATLTLTNCIDGDVGGTVQYEFNEVVATPVPYVDADMNLNLTGTVDGVAERNEAEFSFRAFRDPAAKGFDYFGRDSYWFLTEGGVTTKNACFNVNLRLSDSNVEFTRSEIVIVNGQNRLFTAFGRPAPVLAFQGDVLVDGSGVDFFAEVARADGYCGVVGASEGINPGSTGMTLLPDQAVADGVLLSFPGGSIETTWNAILDD